MSPRRIPVDSTVIAPRPGATRRLHLRFPGLDPSATYRLRPLLIGERPSNLIPPPWPQRALEEDGLALPGAVLVRSGLAAPLLDPEQGLLFPLVRETDPAPVP